MMPRLCIPLLLFVCGSAVGEEALQVSGKIDELLKAHWEAHGVQPAEQASDAEFLRRVTLDLAGRIPTLDEVDQFLANDSSDKRQQLIDRLLNGPEFPLHFGNVLDGMIQDEYAGNEAFVDYLLRGLRERKSWDTIFREIMLGPWDTDESKPANRFLDKRAKQLDELTSDAARVFFGVDISCAKCHDHPLVDDWKQQHFFGMASFFNRTTGGKGTVGEKTDGEVTFLGSDGKEQTAKLMFLTGTVFDEPSTDEQKKARYSRREQLVTAALEEKTFFSRAIVNRLWEYFFARGLVDPVDQIHSGNEPAVPEVLSFLAEDFSQHGYDLHPLIAAMASTRAYGLSSRWPHEGETPSPRLFAAARLRPLSQQQLAFSLLLATGNAQFESPSDVQSRVERYVGVSGIRRIEQYLTIEGRANEIAKSLDPRAPEFQSSAGEALFMSNNEAIDSLVGGEHGLAARLTTVEDSNEVVTRAIRQIYGRLPEDDELKQLSAWLGEQGNDRAAACRLLVWSLVSSAEFRFNH